MITLYSWATGNGRRASIMLEECGLRYEVRPVELATKVQKSDWYLAINPDGRIPAITDDDAGDGKPVTISESGAILMYLAEKSGKFLPRTGAARAEALKWLFVQTSNLSPMCMQVHWLGRAQEEGNGKLPNVSTYFTVYQDEVRRLYRLMDRRLADAEYLAGDYSIADIAAYPWVFRYPQQGISLESTPNLARWAGAVAQRPAVKRGMQIPPRKDGL
jgi:GSH-dependent disulfide-bond oxidoreductase